MKRACLECGRLFSGRGPRCEPHRLAHERTRRPTTGQRGYHGGWDAFSRGRIAEVGYCQAQPCPYPDCGTTSNPLTVDHVTLGLVLCRRCNSAKQHRDREAGGTLAT